MKIALFGGTFNPIHIGHLAIADSMLHQFDIDKLFFVPVNMPPHKAMAKGATTQQRLEMIKLSIQGNDKFFIEDCELKRGGLSYTWQTLTYINKKYSSFLEQKPFYLIGSDWLTAFDTWSKPQTVADLSTLVIAKRPRDSIAQTSFEEGLKQFCYAHEVLKTEPLAISSSAIRHSIKTGGSYRYLVTKEVYHYIKENNLYI